MPAGPRQMPGMLLFSLVVHLLLALVEVGFWRRKTPTTQKSHFCWWQKPFLPPFFGAKMPDRGTFFQKPTTFADVGY
jgi:hypothetical protein